MRRGGIGMAFISNSKNMNIYLYTILTYLFLNLFLTSPIFEKRHSTTELPKGHIADRFSSLQMFGSITLWCFRTPSYRGICCAFETFPLTPPPLRFIILEYLTQSEFNRPLKLFFLCNFSPFYFPLFLIFSLNLIYFPGRHSYSYSPYYNHSISYNIYPCL